MPVSYRTPRLSIVIPTLDESARIGELVARARKEADEVVVSDGGSNDATATIAKAAGATVCVSPPGRGCQLDAGARSATGGLFLFLHADTELPPGAGNALRWAAGRALWGCFSVRVESDDLRLRWCGRYMTARARHFGTATGDMAIWSTRELFERIGGFGPRKVCEDLDFSKRAARQSPPMVLPLRVATSARRWQAEGLARTMSRMWLVRAGFHLGVSDSALASWYRSAPR